MHCGKKYALVAGGAGFIGSHLVDSLLGDGWYVDVVDNFTTGRPENVKHNLSKVDDWGEAFLSVQHGDVTVLKSDPARDNGRTLSQYDVVYNLACPASPKAYQADGVGTVMTNVLGAANLLALAMAHRAAFVQASTSEVYGDPQEHPQSESYWGNVNPYGPRSCYDEGKRCAETLCYEFAQIGADVRVARIFNTYGPRMDPDDGRVVSNFIRQAIRGEALTVYGAGDQTRSFCYVGDLVAALRKLADTPTPPAGPVNIGNDGEFTIMELAEALSEWFPRLVVVNEPLPQDDPKVRKPNLSLARAALGYAPLVPLRVGLEKTIAWMRGRLAQ
jgi:UDP-glucuronate decarboxylase